MESNGYPMCVHMSERAREQLVSEGEPEEYFVRAGQIKVKGKGCMETYFAKVGDWEAAVAHRRHAHAEAQGHGASNGGGAGAHAAGPGPGSEAAGGGGGGGGVTPTGGGRGALPVKKSSGGALPRVAVPCVRSAVCHARAACRS